MSRLRMQTYTQDLMDAQRILINPLNCSSSKQQYSFSKAERFERCKTQNQNYRFYNIPSTRSRKVTTIGKSQRDSYSYVKNAAPSPISYNYATDGQFAYSVNFKSRKSRGYGFGLGRSEVKANNFLNLKLDTPDPWAYNSEKIKTKPQKQFSFAKAKKQSFKKIELPSLVPGPGSYKISTSLDQAKQLLSIHAKSGSPKLFHSKTMSKKPQSIKYPPLYHPKTTSKGEALNLSRTKKGPIIGLSTRLNISKSSNPGPGHYKVFSQFISKGKI